MRSGIRFKPPEVELSGELEWVLQRAFGPLDLPAFRVGEGALGTISDLVRRFSLTERIGSRVPTEILEKELGEDLVREFREATLRSAVLSIVADRICHQIAELGGRLGLPLIFLKGAALQLSGKVSSGSRNMCDVDVLVSEEGAMRLQCALVEGGCRPLEVPESEHQLQFLTHPEGLGIEVHKIIPGVRLDGRSSATARRLVERELVQPAPGLNDGSFLPTDDVLLAHLLVHGIAQHGMSPHSYPMARMLADVQDLGVDEGRLQEFVNRGFAWIAKDVSREEAAAAASLAGRLQRGEAPEAIAASGDGAGVLLRHLVAGTLDEGYDHSMRFGSLTVKPTDIGWLRSVAKALQGALLPTKAQIDILYGPPRSELGYWGWRLWRPFDLMRRAIRYGTAWLRQRARSRN